VRESRPKLGAAIKSAPFVRIQIGTDPILLAVLASGVQAPTELARIICALATPEREGGGLCNASLLR
jgi:hypothetical protein